jgi:hypothetical protein
MPLAILFCEFFVVLVLKYFLPCFMYKMLLVDCEHEKIGSRDLDGFARFRGGGRRGNKCAEKLTFQPCNTFFTDWLTVFRIETYIFKYS